MSDLTQSYPFTCVFLIRLICVVVREFSGDQFELLLGEALFVLDLLLLADCHWLIVKRCGSLVELFPLFCFEFVHKLSFGIPLGYHVISALTLLDILTVSVSTVFPRPEGRFQIRIALHIAEEGVLILRHIVIPLSVVTQIILIVWLSRHALAGRVVCLVLLEPY